MKHNSHSVLFLVVASMLWVIFGTSCNTLRDVGRDVRHAGGHIERAAN